MSQTWREEYLAALLSRDRYEQATAHILQAYTTLADDYTSLQQGRDARTETPPPKSQRVSRHDSDSRVPPSLLGQPAAQLPPPFTTVTGDAESRLRSDLLSANRNVLGLNNQILALRAELEDVRHTAAQRDAQISALDGNVTRLDAEKLSLNRKLRDRESELKEKARLVSEVQDENLSLEMQLNVSDERARRLEQENKDLVERWMRRVGSEAEAMNRGSGWK